MRVCSVSYAGIAVFVSARKHIKNVRQVTIAKYALEKGAKNFSNATELKTVADENRQVEQDTKGVIAVFTAKEITLNLNKTSIERNLKALRMLQQQGADILNPEATFKTLLIARKLANRTENEFSEEPWTPEQKPSSPNHTFISAKSQK